MPKNFEASRRRELLRGLSHEVESSNETTRRRSALLRMRDRSLGYYNDGEDLSGNGSFGASPLSSKVTSSINLTVPQSPTPINLMAEMRLNGSPMSSQQTLISLPNRHFNPHYTQQFQGFV